MKEVTRLKQEYIEIILGNPQLQGNIAVATGKRSTNTVYRWCKDNSEQLTMLPVLDCIRKFKELSPKVELTEKITLPENQPTA